MLSIDYEKINIGDILICSVLSVNGIIPVKHTVTKINFLDMYGVRHDTGREVVVLGASILKHEPVQQEDKS